MKTNTRERIVDIITKKGRVAAKDLVDLLNISRQGLFLQIAKLMREGEIAKVGKSPRVYYYIPETKLGVQDYALDKETANFVNQRYLYVTPLGAKLQGMSGFEEWCRKTKQEVVKTAKEYVLTQKRYDKWMKKGMINGIDKLKRTFPKVYLDELCYLDFYSIERFGKTKLGQLLLYAKQSQSREVIRELVMEVKMIIKMLVKNRRIDAVGFIPPTVKREVQLMRELEGGLELSIPTLVIHKIKSELMVPQKTLSSLADRVDNAAKTMVVEDGGNYKNILLIDDAVGSGATLNETAKQIRERGICGGKIIGLAVVGSFKGFDVISEV